MFILLCDRLLDLSILSKKCPKFIVVININFIVIPYQDSFITQPYMIVSDFNMKFKVWEAERET